MLYYSDLEVYLHNLMQEYTMFDKLSMRTKDLTEDNVEKIAQLFPSCVTEAISEDGSIRHLIDFEALKRQLSEDVIPDGKERYVFTWPGKSKTQSYANTSSTCTLRPKRNKSINFDISENIYIEGDNFEALKLLRETYLGKIKLIYIDPPYNTGNDFVYNDCFSLSSKQYNLVNGDLDDDGNRLIPNPNSSGKFHTIWLNMMYSRLLLSKDLLSEDGVIFISIDDNEVHNLRKICDEIFGSNAFVACIPILSNPRGRQSSSFIAQTHEYGLVYAKNIDKCKISGEELTVDQKKEYSYTDSKGSYRLLGLRLRGGRATATESPTLHFPIYYNEKNNDFSVEHLDGYDYEIIPKFEDGTLGTWRWSKKKIISQKDELVVKPVKNRYDVFQKDYLTADKRMKLKSLWNEKEINYDNSARELSALDLADVFPYAKPLYLIKKIVKSMVPDSGIIMDFFSGSATTAQAVFEANVEDGNNRRFILIQWPEICPKESTAFARGFYNICDIGEERIRRVINSLNSPQTTLDSLKTHQSQGYRVFVIDDSNMNDVFYDPQSLKKDILDYATDNIKSDRTGEDLLFQVMLELGIELSAPISKDTINSKEIFFVDSNYLIACFDQDIDDDIVTTIADRKPYYAVFRDSSMSSDAVAINFNEIFKTYSPNTITKVL